MGHLLHLDGTRGLIHCSSRCGAACLLVRFGEMLGFTVQLLALAVDYFFIGLCFLALTLKFRNGTLELASLLSLTNT